MEVQLVLCSKQACNKSIFFVSIHKFMMMMVREWQLMICSSSSLIIPCWRKRALINHPYMIKLISSWGSLEIQKYYWHWMSPPKRKQLKFILGKKTHTHSSLYIKLLHGAGEMLASWKKSWSVLFVRDLMKTKPKNPKVNCHNPGSALVTFSRLAFGTVLGDSGQSHHCLSHNPPPSIKSHKTCGGYMMLTVCSSKDLLQVCRDLL